ncbi:MAG: glycosyltransferase family 4 protein [Anaerolineales bacterium]
MLIGIDASRAALAQRTGTENYSLYLIREMIALGEEHRFRLYFNRPPQDGLFVRNERVQWRIMPFPRLWTHLRLAWEVTRHPPDVLYVPAHVVPWLHPRRCVVSIHDLGYLHYPQAHTRWGRWYLDLSTRFNARSARRVIAASRATRRDLISHYRVNPEKIVVAYPAGTPDLVPVTDPATLERVRHTYHTGERYFCYMGTLQPRKNLDTLLKAFASLIARGEIADDVKLVLAGKRGWKCEEIVELARTRVLKEHVVLPGYVPSRDLPALLSGALAYVLPSLYEGFGLPVLEAMACDTPVICSDVSSLPEVAGDAALYVSPHDTEGWARAMARIYHDGTLWQELIARGQERVKAFSWEQCAQAVLAALEIVGGGQA